MKTKDQRATVEIDVSVPVSVHADKKEVESQICRTLRLEIPDSITLHPPLLRENITLENYK